MDLISGSVDQRSSSEAKIALFRSLFRGRDDVYRRLDTLTETGGRFRLNVALPIPFDGFGTREVDLLCADARLVIELDGGKHLADPVEPRSPVLVGERVAGCHLGDVRRGVQVVGVGEPRTESCGEWLPDRGLAGAGDAHHHHAGRA